MPTSFTVPDHQVFANQLNFFAWLNNLRNLGIGILTNAGAPTSGTSGTFAGKAGPACLLLDTTNTNLYMNVNTKASPTWVLQLRGANFSGDVTSTAAGVTTIGALKVATGMIQAAAVTSAKIDATVIQTVTLPLTNAQIKAIRATPITIVAAPGAGFAHFPLACLCELVYGGNNAFTAAAGDNLAIKYKDGTTSTLLSGAVQAFVQGTASAFSLFLPITASNVTKANADNQPLVIHNITAGEIAGNAAADNTMNVILKYATHPTV